MIRRLLVTIALVVAGLLAGGPLVGAGVAWAHAGGLTSSTNEPVLLAVQPAVPGLDVAVVEYGARLRLTNRTEQRVTVLPQTGSTLSVLLTVAAGGQAFWSDPRVTAAAALQRPPDGRLEWRIPLRVGDTPVTLLGEQRWPPPPNAAVWWLVTGLALVLPSGLVALGCRRAGAAAPAWVRATLAGATAVVVAAHVAHICGSALVPAQGALIWVFLGAAGFAVFGWPIGVAGALLTLRGQSTGPLLCLVSGALLALIIAPADVVSFHDAVVPYAWGADLDRALIALTVGGGLGVVAAATVLLRRVSPSTEPPSSRHQERP